MPYDFTPWAELQAQFRWKQGEHVTAVAPTGAGKTTLFSELMRYRGHNIMFGTKMADDTYTRILKQGYRRIESVSEIKPYHNNYLLWPRKTGDIEDWKRAQHHAFGEAIEMIVDQGSWTLWADESKYLCQMLGLERALTFCLEQLRSVNATIICGSQRPAFLPLSALANATHIFLWKTPLKDDAKRLSDIGGIDAKEIMEALKELGEYEFLYIKTRGTEARVTRSKVERR
jgi:hypothetical protein